MTTRISVSQRVAPRASDASRSVRGTANSASSATEQMVGAHERQHERGVQQVEPGIRPEPVLQEGAINDHAEKPMTTEGNAASSSTNGLTMRRVRLAAIPPDRPPS